MSERGYSLLEVLVAAAALAIVLLGIGTFYVGAARLVSVSTAQTSLQRQATMVIEEMTRQIQTASALDIGACGANSLVATNSCGVFCFHRDGTGTQLLEDRQFNNPLPPECAGLPAGGGGTANLLAGALIPAGGNAGLLTTLNTACSAATASVPYGAIDGGFCPSVITHNGTNCPTGAAVTFRLRFQIPETTSFETMTFSTTIAGRNLPPIPPATACP